MGTNTPDTVNFLICNGNNAGCQAAFQSYNDTATQFMVYFNDYSTPQGSISAWHWDFGDGSPASILQNPTHIYPAMGTYTVCLTIETSNNCTSVVCNNVTVGEDTQCQAHYNFYADSLNVLHVHFWDTSTPANLITSRSWNFGDPLSGLNNISTNFDPWHLLGSRNIQNHPFYPGAFCRQCPKSGH